MKTFKVYYKVTGSDEMFILNIKDVSAEVVKRTLDNTLCAWFKGIAIIKIEEN